MADQPTVVDVNDRARRRRESFDAEFPAPADRALIGWYLRLHDTELTEVPL